ncbi:MAG: anthranilate synthase component I family protein [Deltaproteobacteria bacterium]|nr:anthranilate synthase component I family protein [Deltaproteobacteria bacterium]
MTRLNPFERLRTLPHPVLLESGGNFDADGRRTIVAADPFAVLTVRGGVATVTRRGQGATRCLAASWDALRDFVDAHTARAAIVIGMTTYEAGLEIEGIRSRHEQSRFLPEVHFAAYDDFEETPVAHRTCAKSSHDSPSPRGIPHGLPRIISSNFDRDGYLSAVERVLAYERAGDIYQANLSQRFEAPFRGDPFRLFDALQTVNPAPFAAYLETPEFAVACNSPERLVSGHIRSREIESRPIKGTARDGETLVASAKDRAEHLMIVDLVRNDLGAVAETGSVVVGDFARIVQYPTLWHSVSTVRARMREGTGAVEALRALSPGGSVTGCPKVRAMEIIDELERAPRGVYCGSIGYIKHTGEFDFNIAIRTAVVAGGRAHYAAGGAVVADSDPAAEYDETLLKAVAFFDAINSFYPR